jgi:hypothetical protein
MAPLLCKNREINNIESGVVFYISDDIIKNEKVHVVEEDEEESSTSTAPTVTSSSSSSSSSLSCLVAAATINNKRSVSFSTEAAVHIGAVINIDDYTNEEKYNAYYCIDEMRKIRQEVKDTVALMNQMIPRDEIESTTTDSSFCYHEHDDEQSQRSLLCIRGLEGKTRTGKRHRRATRMKSISAVFDEQSMQDMDGINDPVMIAMSYNEYSYPMQVAAFQRAAQYQKEAQEEKESNEEEQADADADNNQDNNNDHSSLSSISLSSYTSFSSSSSTNNTVSNNVGPSKYDFHKCRSMQSMQLSSTTATKTNNLDLLEIESQEDYDDEFSSFITNNSNCNNNTVHTTAHANATYTEQKQQQLVSLDGIIIIQDFEQRNNNNRHYNNNIGTSIGPMRFRDRLACLLPTSSSSSPNRSTTRNRRNVLGALRVVHI